MTRKSYLLARRMMLKKSEGVILGAALSVLNGKVHVCSQVLYHSLSSSPIPYMHLAYCFDTKSFLHIAFFSFDNLTFALSIWE